MRNKMKITRRQISKVIFESMHGYQGRQKSYNQVSDGTKRMAQAAKRRFAKDYPSIKVSIDGRNGWILVNGKKAVNISSASGRPMDIEDMIDKMKKSYLGHPMTEGILYVTRGPYSMTVEDEQEEYIPIAAMVSALFDAGDEDVFQAPQGIDPKSLENLKKQNFWDGSYGFDGDALEDYYSVDPDRVLRLYARLMNHNIEEVPYED